MTIKVCDLCKKNNPDAKIKYKYKAAWHWTLWHESGWIKMELCQDCLEKIIKAENDKEDEENGRRE